MKHSLNRRITVIALLVFLLAVQLACNFPYRVVSSPGAVAPDLLSRTSQEDWLGWVRRLSGAEPVTIGGQVTTISTRYSYAMFTGQENARAFDYVLEQVRQWYPEDQIEIDEYPYTDAERTYTFKNLVVTIPGQTRGNEVVMLTAHLDSIVVREGNALEAAPGANDNATGVAALLEAARLLKDYRYERTIRIIFFSGEELGLAGSRAYVADHPLDGIVGVVNLDMFGYDSNGDRCFEIHAGTLPASDAVGQVFAASIAELGLDLRYDYLTAGATDRSDHAAFWERQVGAITVIENFFDDNLPNGCQGVDGTPYYHRPADTVDHINPDFAYSIVQAALNTVVQLAVPQSSPVAVPTEVQGWYQQLEDYLQPLYGE